MVDTWEEWGAMEYIERCEFELEVMVAGKPPYKVKHRQSTPFAVFSQLSKGMILPVKVHPEKPGQVLLDWEQMGTQVLEGADLKDRLSELEDAYKEGLVTADEYESKRAEILKNL